MTESQRLEIIKNAFANSEGSKIVPMEFKGFLDEVKSELATEDFTVEHGTQHASNDEIKQEFESFDGVEEKENFDEDENLVDMDRVSGAMRDACEG
jgi:hypothetical protein